MGTCEFCAQYNHGWCNYHEMNVAATEVICDAMRYHIEESTFGEVYDDYEGS